MKKVVIYGRVSTQSQEWKRQVEELRSLAQSRGWVVVKVFTEKISGAKSNSERKSLTEMIEFIEVNDVNKVLVTELSRLGRDTLQVLQAVEILNKKGVSLYIQNYGIETLNEDGSINAMAQFMITLLAEVLFSAMSPTNHFWAISTSSCCSLDIFSTVVRSSFVSGRV